METLVSFFEEVTKKFGPQLALKMRPRWRTVLWNYSKLWNFASGIAQMLEERGIKKGDRIVLIAPNSPYWVGTFFGAFLKGAVVVPLNPKSTEEFINKVIKETDAKIVFRQADLVGLGELAEHPHSFQEEVVEPEDIAEILYTSGTTDDPKGVVLTHSNIMANLKTLDNIAKIFLKGGRLLSILPLFHMYEQMAGMLVPFKNGSLIVYIPNLSSGTISSALKENRISHMIAVPEFLGTLMARMKSKGIESLKYLPRFLWPKPLRHLRTIVSGGASLHPDLEREWMEFGYEILQGYGLTETSPVLSTNIPTVHRAGSVGKVLPGIDLKIAPDGEILVRGPSVFSGYYKDEEKTKTAFENGWFKTDDLGYLDKDGFLYILGRKRYMILGPSGENVYPEDIECVLNKIKGVKDSAVVGIEKDGHMTIHAVILTDLTDASEIVCKANSKLAPYQQIQAWSTWPHSDFPRSATRKIRKGEVIKWLKTKETAPPIFAQESTPLIQMLFEISKMPAESINNKSNLVADLHLDSLMRIELVGLIEENFNSIVEERFITAQTTVKDLEALIEKGKSLVPKFKFKTWPLSRLARFFRFPLQELILFPYYLFWIRLKISGQENLKNLAGPVLFMVNHLSYIDVAIIMKALPKRFRTHLGIAAAPDVLYTEYKPFIPLVELIFNTYPFPRKEDENIKTSLDLTGRFLDHNFSILVFPEGQLSLHGEILPLKKGSGLLAAEMGVLVVPITIKGAAQIVLPERIIPHRSGEIKIKIGTALKFKATDSYIEATKRIEEAMRELYRSD